MFTNCRNEKYLVSLLVAMGCWIDELRKVLEILKRGTRFKPLAFLFTNLWDKTGVWMYFPSHRACDSGDWSRIAYKIYKICYIGKKVLNANFILYNLTLLFLIINFNLNFICSFYFIISCEVK